MTNTVRFEQQYPVTAREKEIKQILGYVTRGQSCQLVSVPGAGRSTVIRLLAFHPTLVKHQLSSLKGVGLATSIVKGYGHTSDQNKTHTSSHNKNYTQFPFLFTYANFAEIPSFDTNELIKFLFLAILSSIETNKQLYREVYSLFKEAVKVGDPQLLFQNFKKAIELCNHAAMSTIFLFDRFSEFSDKIPPDFYAGLYSLRLAGNRPPIVFSTHRPLKELLPQDILQKFDQFFVDNLILLEPYDEVTNNTRVALLEKEYGKKLAPQTKKEIIRLTGGHGKLTKLAAQILLDALCHPELVSGSQDSDLRQNDILDFLLSHALIKNSLLEIWQSLSTQDREKSLFPLYDEFIKLGLPQTLVPKIIRFNQSSNEIYFGDQALSGLTAQEFKLLKFLIQNPQRVVERDEVINAVWAGNKTQAGVSDEALDQMVYRLRRKIEDEADNPKHLLTVKGRGFRFLPSTLYRL